MKFKELQEPIYMAHRGARNVFPEASLEAYQNCFHSGLNILEMDVRLSADGTLILHHDDTADRTLNKTGQISNYSVAGFKSAKVDCLPGWQGTPCLLEELFQEFGDKAVYTIEVKQRNISEKLFELILKYNLQENVLIQSFSAPDLSYFVQNGIPVCYLKNKSDIDPITIKGWGFNSVGLSTSLSDSYIAECIKIGLKVYMYTVNKRYEHDYYLDLGVHGFFSDDPLWIMRKSPVLGSDPFHEQVFTHGQFSPSPISGYVDGDRGCFVYPNQFGWVNEGVAGDFSLQGWAGELNKEVTVQLKINYLKTVSNVRWASVAICTPKDFWDDYTNSLCGGYHILLRENGSLDFYIREIGKPAVLLKSISTSPISQGQTVELKIQVTSSAVIVTRIDTNQSIIINDTTFRGGYLHFGRRVLGATFENVTVKTIQ